MPPGKLSFLRTVENASWGFRDPIGASVLKNYTVGGAIACDGLFKRAGVELAGDVLYSFNVSLCSGEHIGRGH